MSDEKGWQYNPRTIRLWWMKHKKKVFTLLAVLASLCAVAAIAMAIWVRLPEIPISTRPSTSGSQSTSGDGTETDSSQLGATGSERREGVYTFLVVGRDEAAGLTDTMILITYDTINKTIDALSLPRDTMINVSTSYKKLNGVYNLNKGSDKDTQVENGMNALKAEVEKLTGIYPDFYVMVDWDAVGNLVDAIGGVWFDVPYTMDYDDPEQDLYIHQEKGYRLLTGDDAMQVIRHRKNNDGSYSVGDVGRMAVQQDFLMAVAEQCLTPAMILKASTLVDIFLEQVTTDLTVGNLLAFAQNAMGINVSEDVNITTMPYTDYYRYSSYVLPIQDELLAILNDGLNPYVEDITAEDLNLLYQIDSAGRLAATSGTLLDPSLADPIVYTSTTTTTPETTEDENQVTEPETDLDSELDSGLDGEPGDVLDGQEDVESEFSDSGEELFPQPEPILPDTETEITQEETDTSLDLSQEEPASTEVPQPLEESDQTIL